MSTVVTTNHDEIRQWAESHKGRPARVKGTGSAENHDPGMLRIDFDAPEKGLDEITWEAWFETFEKNHLALIHSSDSRFNKLVSRDRL